MEKRSEVSFPSTRTGVNWPKSQLDLRNAEISGRGLPDVAGAVRAPRPRWLSTEISLAWWA